MTEAKRRVDGRLSSVQPGHWTGSVLVDEDEYQHAIYYSVALSICGKPPCQPMQNPDQKVAIFQQRLPTKEFNTIHTIQTTQHIGNSQQISTLSWTEAFSILIGLFENR